MNSMKLHKEILKEFLILVKSVDKDKLSIFVPGVRYKCQDGAYISYYYVCDGQQDCPGRERQLSM